MMYHEAIKKSFKKIPTMKSKPLSHDKKNQKLQTDICGHWYVEKMNKGLPRIRKQTISKKAHEKY